MHLQSLELFGFKSFADKTVFNFHEGVTAIVGPNGCGKSNVLDAVRWVLGEQSAKALRGGEMADVIFNGTDSRKPVGYAEVSLTFTDCANELGVDWHDVRVTRRVYRDGLSEYLLNKTVCRLKDIYSLFADTGIGRSAYSMMEQGRIDQILSSHPEDRRAVFEEAAGITKYKGQKREALRKLEATEANLLRLGDIIKEVKRQIGSLQRQAGKARRYQALLADLQVLDTHHSREQLESLQAELEGSRLATVRFDEEQRTTEREIEEHENEVAARRGRLEEVDAHINGARADVQRLQNEIASHRDRIEFNRERAEELTALDDPRSDVRTAEAKLAQQETEIHDTDLLLSETEIARGKQSNSPRSTIAPTRRREREKANANYRRLSWPSRRRRTGWRSGKKSRNSPRAALSPLAELVSSLGEASDARDGSPPSSPPPRPPRTNNKRRFRIWRPKFPCGGRARPAATTTARLRRTMTSDRAIAERQSHSKSCSS
jgi:chromosome segregation protein